MTRSSAEDEQAIQTRRNRVALLAVSLGSAQAAMTLSSIQVSIPDIASDLDASAIEVSWIPMAFLLFNAIFILPIGRFADAFGRKRTFLLGMTLFGISNYIAGLAQSMESLLVFRALQGFATAMLHSTAMAIIASLFTGAQRTAALGIAAASIYFGLSFGPAFGGYLTEYFGWRSVFTIQLPISMLILLLAVRSLKGEWKSDEPLAVDWWGTMLFAASLTSLVVAISLPFGSSDTLWLRGVLLGFAVIVAWQFYRHLGRASSPLIRLQAVRGNPVFSSALCSAFFIYSGNYTLVFLTSLFMQYLLGLTPSTAGLFILLQPVTIAMVSLLVGRPRFAGLEKIMVAFGSALVAASFLLLIFVDSSTSLLWVSIALVVNGLGMGIFSAPNNSSAFGSVDSQRLSAASAILNLARYLGNMLGTGIVLLMMALLIGQESIAPENYSQLESVVRYAFSFAFVSASVAAAFGFRFYWQSR